MFPGEVKWAKGRERDRAERIASPQEGGNALSKIMALVTQRFRWRLTAREIRLLLYVLVLLGVVAWKFVPRPWRASITFEAPHYLIYSTATQPQTADTAQ